MNKLRIFIAGVLIFILALPAQAYTVYLIHKSDGIVVGSADSPSTPSIEYEYCSLSPSFEATVQAVQDAGGKGQIAGYTSCSGTSIVTPTPAIPTPTITPTPNILLYALATAVKSCNTAANQADCVSSALVSEAQTPVP